MNQSAYHSHQGLFRVFIVGCPRSGTTLMQSLIAAHPRLVSLPETHFWPTLMRHRRFWRLVGCVAPSSRHRAIQKLEAVRLKPAGGRWPRTIRFNCLCRAFCAALDALALDSEADGWVEKTPRHLHFIDEIQRAIPGARFVHVLRDGREVVASMRQVTRDDPETWSGERDVPACLNRWLNDIGLSLAAIQGDRHLPVLYEDLVADPVAATRRVCKFIGLHWSADMLRNRVSGLSEVIESNRGWDDRLGAAISDRGSAKFNRVLNQAERDLVKKTLSTAGLLDLRVALDRAERLGTKA